MKNLKKTIKEIGIVIFGCLLSLYAFEYNSNIKNEKKIINLINAAIQSIEKKQTELEHTNIKPIFEYNPKDTLYFHKEPFDFEYDIFYDRLIASEDTYLKMDSEFYKKIISFKIKHKKIINRYLTKENDFFRNKVKRNINLIMAEEKEILKGEIDYLENKISKDSLLLIRNTAFRKYINYDF